MPTKATYGEFSGFVNQGITLMDRVTQGGINITPSTVQSITRTTTRENNGSPVVVENQTALTVATAVQVSLVGANGSDSKWTRDSIGYNFIDIVPPTSFPAVDRYYVAYKITPVSGTPFVVEWRGNILGNAGAI